MHIVACGQDLIGIERFRAFYGDRDSGVLDRVFTREEQTAAFGEADAVSYLAVCFAAKEAVMKTIDGLEQGIALTDILVIAATSARVSVQLSGGAADAAALRGIDSVVLTTTRSAGLASALAIACGNGTPNS